MTKKTEQNPDMAVNRTTGDPTGRFLWPYDTDNKKNDLQNRRILAYNLKGELEHGIYVADLARDIAREMNMPESTVYLFTQAGLLHDVGKLMLVDKVDEPDDEGPYMIEEMKCVRTHASLSYDILNARHYPMTILEAVKHHHENYDGTGYPDNLHGNEIPLGARLIRVCDVFAALTSDRPYRKSFTKEEAISLMIDEVNHFDLGIFLAFQRVVHRVDTDYQYHFKERQTQT